MHAVPRFQATGFKRDLAEFRVNPDQFGYPVVFPAILIAQLLGFNMGLFIFSLPMHSQQVSMNHNADHTQIKASHTIATSIFRGLLVHFLCDTVH